MPGRRLARRSSLQGFVLMWVRHAGALCLIFSSPPCLELHYYLMRSFHSRLPLELEGGVVHHHTGPRQQRWGVGALRGALGQHCTPLLSLPREEEDRTGLLLRWDVLVGRGGTLPVLAPGAGRGSASVSAHGAAWPGPMPTSPTSPSASPASFNHRCFLPPPSSALPDTFSFKLPK